MDWFIFKFLRRVGERPRASFGPQKHCDRAPSRIREGMMSLNRFRYDCFFFRAASPRGNLVELPFSSSVPSTVALFHPGCILSI